MTEKNKPTLSTISQQLSLSADSLNIFLFYIPVELVWKLSTTCDSDCWAVYEVDMIWILTSPFNR